MYSIISYRNIFNLHIFYLCTLSQEHRAYKDYLYTSTFEPIHYTSVLWHNKIKPIINIQETAFSLLPLQDTGIRTDSET
jgi:hypothetical protein